MAFICNLCQRQYQNKRNFTQHFLTEHSTQEKLGSSLRQEPKIFLQPDPTTNLRNNSSICVCEICFKSARSMISLSSHILSHVGAMPYFCKPCLFATLSKQKFRQHSKHSQVSDNECSSHECDLCDGTFSTLLELVCHYAHHLRAMPFICKICKVMFSEKKDFTIHNHLHKNSLECDICHFIGTSQKNLLQHVLSHNPTKYFKEIRNIVSSVCLSNESKISCECDQSVTKSLDSEQKSVTKSLKSEQQSVSKSIDSEQQSVSKSLESVQQPVSKSLYCSNVSVTRSDDKIHPRDSDEITKGTCLQKNNLVSRGTMSMEQFKKRIMSKGGNMAIVKPIQTSPQSKMNHSTNPIVSTGVTSRSLLLSRTLYRGNSNLCIQPESNNSIAQIPKKNMTMVLQKLPIGGNTVVKDCSSSYERFGIRNLCSRINKQNDQSNYPSTKVQDSNSSTETFIIQNLHPRVNNLTTQNDQPNNLTTEVQDPSSSNENKGIQNLLISGNTGVKDCSSSNECYGIRNLCSRISNQNDQSNYPSTKVQDSNSSTETFIIQNLHPRVDNLTTRNDQPNNQSTEVQDPSSSNEDNVILNLHPEVNHLKEQKSGHTNNSSIDVQDPSPSSESNVVQNSCSKVVNLKDQNDQPSNPPTEIQNSNSSNESNIKNVIPRFNSLSSENDPLNNPSFEVQDSTLTNESNAIQNLRSRVNSLKPQKDQLNNPTAQVPDSCSANESNVIRNLRPRVNKLKDQSDLKDNRCTKVQNSSSSNESNAIRNLRSRVKNQKALNNLRKKSRVCKQQKMKPLNAPTPYQNHSEDLLKNTENSTDVSVDTKLNEICIARNLKQCYVILDRLPDYFTNIHLSGYHRNTSDTKSKPKSPESKVDVLDSPSLINVDNIKTEIISDDEIDSSFGSLKNTIEIAHVTSVSDYNSFEISCTSPYCPNSCDSLKQIGGKNTNSGEITTCQSESELSIMQEESLIKSFASLSNKSIASSKLKSIKRKQLTLSKILPKPAKHFKGTSNKKKNMDSSRNVDIIKLHPALEDHNYFLLQVQSTSGS